MLPSMFRQMVVVIAHYKFLLQSPSNTIIASASPLPPFRPSVRYCSCHAADPPTARAQSSRGARLRLSAFRPPVWLERPIREGPQIHAGGSSGHYFFFWWIIQELLLINDKGICSGSSYHCISTNNSHRRNGPVLISVDPLPAAECQWISAMVISFSHLSPFSPRLSVERGGRATSMPGLPSNRLF